MVQTSHQKRGKPSEEWLFRYRNAKEGVCLLALTSLEPQERSAAAIALSPYTKHIVIALCNTLKKESCLYTRIAICETLAKGNQETAHWMCPYLGQIGHNQHTSLPERVSLKRSYPLPRDLIARTLGKMDVIVLPELYAVLKHGTFIQKREVLDAIGFLLFYHPEHDQSQAVELILHILYHEQDEILLWKAIMVCFALSDQRIKQVLELYTKSEIHLLREEANKSLSQLVCRK